MAVPVKLPNPAPIIQGAIMAALRESAPILKNAAIANLDRVLRRKSGKLASSIYARVRKFRSGGKLTVGTAVLYGRFWEYGFFRGGKGVRGLLRGAARKHRARTQAERVRLIKAGAKFYRAKWLRPARDENSAEVIRRVETHLNRAMSQYTGTVSIDIKIT